MIHPHPLWFAALFGVTEFLISFFMRSRGGRKSDQGTLVKLWWVINFSMIGAILGHLFLTSAAFGTYRFYWLGVSLFLIGIAIRWYSIVYLGRFFTVDVTVTSDQKVIDSGPYRYVRHPSYAGVLLAFVAVGVLLANYVSLFLTTVPIVAVFLHRMKVEEAALLAGLGEPYREYMGRTKRLIPFVY
jgi:protein-S-isoprenylcysteine O-methyltransferase